jgi:hypothetical protein
MGADGRAETSATIKLSGVMSFTTVKSQLHQLVTEECRLLGYKTQFVLTGDLSRLPY